MRIRNHKPNGFIKGERMKKNTYEERRLAAEELQLAIDNLRLVITDIMIKDFHIDKLLDWVERKLTRLEQWWGNR